MTETVMLLAIVAVVAIIAGYLVARVQLGKQLSQLEAASQKAQALETEAMRQVAGKTAELKALQDRYNLQDDSLRRLESAQAVAEHEHELLQQAKQQVEDFQARAEQAQRAVALQNAQLSAAQVELEAEKKAHAKQSSRLNELEVALSDLQKETATLSTEKERLQTTLDKERLGAQEKLALLEESKGQLKQEFQNLAQQILEEKSQKFTVQNKEGLDQLLKPLKTQIGDFQRKIDEQHVNDMKDRESLRTQVSQLQSLNQKINEEAANLTRALKGDKKAQGNWGEMILERVLERSGLRKGEEYETQGSFTSEDGRRLRPDVVIHLPEGKDVIVDSKVSLVAYDTYVAAESDAEQQTALKAHIDAVRNHIRTLSDKDYSQLEGIRSLDFVLLFMPIESAFVAAFQHDEKLFSDAFEQNIIVVTPTTLLATLRTIENIWRHERQNRYSRDLADRAGLVYDKLRVFAEDMEKLGKQLQTASNTYDKTMNTLKHGRGNLIAQANRFTELGVRVKKELPKTILETAELETGEPVASELLEEVVKKDDIQTEEKTETAES